MKKLAFISTMRGNAWGGSEFLWAAAAERAIDAGHGVILSVSKATAAHARISRLRERGAAVIAHSPDVAFWRRALWRARGSGRVPRQLRKLRTTFDPVFATNPDTVCLSHGTVYDALWFSELPQVLDSGIPFVTLNHLARDPMPVFTGLERDTLGRYLSAARHNGFAGHEILRIAERQFALSVPNAFVFHNPVNLVDPSILPWSSATPPQFAAVARLEIKHKGHDLLFESLGQPQWATREWKCFLYGEGPDEKYLRDLANHYGIAKKIVFAGQTHDIRALWSENQLLVLPSRYEGLPLSLTEAMLCGRPSVVTAVGDNSHWVVDGITGFVAPAATAELFGEALERAWAARERWREIGIAAHRYVSGRLDPVPGDSLLNMLLDMSAGQTSPTTVVRNPRKALSGILQGGIDSAGARR
jgi:glycosyltransferase involved in cell wall biosynthesis